MFHLFHDWEIIKIRKYFDISFGDRVPYTERVYKCKKCRKVIEDRFYSRHQPLYGHNFELADFK